MLFMLILYTPQISMRKMLDITWNCMNMFDEKKTKHFTSWCCWQKPDFILVETTGKTLKSKDKKK